MLDINVKAQLKKIVGAENFNDSAESRLVYSYDATPGFQSMPDAVIMPRHREDIQRILKLCNNYRIPIVARGSGTNLCAGTCPTHGGIVLVMNHMNRIIEIDEENLTVTVQPGVITQDLIEAVEDKGLFYPPDPSSMNISTMGGNLSENSGGLRGLKYGVTGDYVLGLEVVLPNGSTFRTGGKLAKDVAGYDLTSLFVGSEGTLGVITEATLKLIPPPESKKTMLAVYDNIDAAAQTVSKIIAEKIIPVTLEFLDKPTLEVVEDFANIGLPTYAEAVLLIEQDGPPKVVERDMENIRKICQTEQAVSVEIAQDEKAAADLRTARRSALSALARIKPTTILEDATVPRSKVSEMVKAINQIAKKYNVMICTFGHAGDGNLHPTCLTDARDQEELERVEKAFADTFATAIQLGGTITGEHGVGEMKLPYLEWKLGKEGIAAMQAVKSAFDPNGIMNPGKILAKDNRKRVVVGR